MPCTSPIKWESICEVPGDCTSCHYNKTFNKANSFVEHNHTNNKSYHTFNLIDNSNRKHKLIDTMTLDGDESDMKSLVGERWGDLPIINKSKQYNQTQQRA